ncbi:MAG: serine/threonine protein kinase, partial [Planctomycetota bacterium]
MNEETIKALFQNALELPPHKRAEFLDQACGDDVAVRREIDALLHDHEAAGDFMSEPTGGGVSDAEEPSPEAGTVIGPYTLIDRIGEGGFGVVYVAEQSAPVRRRVALKVIKAGMDTREVVSRFEAEKQALALMDHPHIARVFDAGSTPGGRPYFVMELVKGVPIHEYCDHARLPLRERLDLFAQACDAVQHAHHKGIIHRDLKPSNILVAMQDGAPVPKVIDFGVAKATGVQLTEATFQTRFAQMIGTPQYMSPEQAEMSALGIDTRSDVYSLGVVLYELLTGSTPFTLEEMKRATFDELRHMIREQDPPTPSARLTGLNGNGRKVARARRTDIKRLAKTVHGELDWIVMKALEKDRTRRYETASRLADDIDRYLENRPVEAGPPSVVYRARKFARRNRGALSIAAVVLVALVSASWVYLDRAAEREEVEGAIRISLADAETAHGEGNLEATRAAVQRAEGLVAAGKADPELEADVRTWRNDLDMLTSLDKARMARAAVKDDVFDRVRGTRAYREAFRTYGAAVDEPGAAARIGSSRIRNDLLVALEDWIDSGMGPAVPPSLTDSRLAHIARRQKRGDLPWALLDQVDRDPWRTRLRAAARSGDGEVLRALAAEPAVAQQRPTARIFLAHALVRNDDLALAVEVLRRAQEAYPGDFWVNHDLGSQLLRHDPGARRDVIGYYRAAIAIRADSPGVFVNLGNVFEDEGELDDAERNFRSALKLKPDYVSAGVGLATVFEKRGQMDAALEQYREVVKRAPKSAWAKGVLGEAYANRRRFDDAIRAFREAASMDPESPIYSTNVGMHLGFAKNDW